MDEISRFNAVTRWHQQSGSKERRMAKNIIYCLWREWLIFPFADKINKLPEKTDVWKFRLQDINRKYVRQRGCSYFFLGLEREYKDCNFGLKAETHWSLKQTCQLLVCVLLSSHYLTQRVPATEEIYVRTHSDCIPTTYNSRCPWIKM